MVELQSMSTLITMFLFQAHTHSHTRGRCERPAPSLFLVIISSSEESTRRATLDAPASIAPLTTYVNSAARGAAFSLQVETPDLLRDRQAG